MRHASTIDVGTRKRRRDGINEDAIATAVFENHHRGTKRPVGVFVLCDGVGGEASGDVAAFLATTVVRRELVGALLGPATDRPGKFDLDDHLADEAGTGDDGDGGDPLSADRLRETVQAAVDAAHRRVQAYAEETDGRPATTAVVGVYADGRLHYGWVGDSRAYVVNAEHGRIRRLTRDHAATNRLLERGEIDEEAYARVHEDTTAITRALGGSPYGRPEVPVDFDSIPVFREDVVLLTSDGLVDAYPDVAPLRLQYERATDEAEAREEILDALVTDDEIRDVVLDAADLHGAAEDLVAFANDRGGKDNLSVTLFRDPGAAPTPETPPARGVDAASVTGPETVVEPSAPAAGDRESRDDDDREESADADDAGADDPDGMAVVPPEGDAGVEDGGDDPAAGLAIEGHDGVYEVGDGFTVGRGDVDGSENPNIGLVVGDDVDIEPEHARFERDDGEWLLRDVSTSGTFVRGDDGEWRFLLSAAGIAESRERGFDPETDADGVPDDACRLDDGVTITLHHPQDERAVVLRFFTSADAAERELDAGDDGSFRRFVP